MSKRHKGYQNEEKRFSENQIIKILSDYSAGGKTGKEITREHGLAIQTLYTWKKKFGDISSEEAKRLKSLELENSVLLHIQHFRTQNISNYTI